MKTPCTYLAVLSVFLFAGDAAAALWSTPVPVTEFNTDRNEVSPFPASDGESFYFFRLDPGRLVTATGPSSGGHFDNVTESDSLNHGTYTVTYPWVSPDNLRLYYYESTSDSREISRSVRTAAADLWPVGNGVTELNSLTNSAGASNNVANPSLTPDELTIVFAGYQLTGGLGGYDIWVGTRDSTDLAFGGFTDLSSVNSGSNELHPRLSADGLTLYFASDRKESGKYQLFEATRDASSPFGTPDLLLIDGLPVEGQYPAISADGKDLYFAKQVSGSGYDIYVSHMVPVPGAAVLGLLGLSCAGWWCRRTAA